MAGRKSGQPHTTAVSYFEHEGGYVVVGLGRRRRPNDPQWFKNLRKAATAAVEVGRSASAVRRRSASCTGEERDRVWTDVVLASVPAFAKYETEVGPRIPLACLTPVSAQPAPRPPSTGPTLRQPRRCGR